MFSLFIKRNPLNKENRRPVSLLSHMSKVSKRLLNKQIEAFMSIKLSTKISGFRENYYRQWELTYMLEKWKKKEKKKKTIN